MGYLCCAWAESFFGCSRAQRYKQITADTKEFRQMKPQRRTAGIHHTYSVQSSGALGHPQLKWRADARRIGIDGHDHSARPITDAHEPITHAAGRVTERRTRQRRRAALWRDGRSVQLITPDVHER